MVNSGSRYIRNGALFLTILCSIASTSVKAQTPVQTYDFALSQSSQGNYDIAIKSFKRLQFFDDQNEFPLVYKEIADCYFHKSDYENAYYYYDLASVQPENDSTLPDLAARKVTCKLFTHQYQEALIDLLSFDEQMNVRQRWQLDMLAGITYFYLNEYGLSKEYFLKSADSSQLMLTEKVDENFSQIRYLEKRYNPKTARVLSVIIPGSGQIMAGDYRNGLNSLLLVSGLISTSLAFSGSIGVFDSLFIIAPWFQRYYMGGYQKAYEIAKAKQQNEKNKVLADMVKLLNQPESR